MARCTAPVRGHQSAAARESCPACGGRNSYRSYSTPSYSPSYRSGGSGSSSGGRSSSRSTKPSWSKAGSSVLYTVQEVRALTPIRHSVEKLAERPELDLRDVFLCHAWDDRQGVAKELHDLLDSNGVKVWFSEKDVPLGVPLLRAIDKGLAKSRVGLVLVTPSFLSRIQKEGVADKELSALLSTERLIPIMHGTTFEALNDVSPLLASRSGLSTAEEPIEAIVAKLKELVTI